MGCSPRGRYESDMTEWLYFHFSLWCIGEGNGNPLQCSCLGNPRDGGAWWAAVYGVAQSRTQLKRLSSSSNYSNSVERNLDLAGRGSYGSLLGGTFTESSRTVRSSVKIDKDTTDRIKRLEKGEDWTQRHIQRDDCGDTQRKYHVKMEDWSDTSTS